MYCKIWKTNLILVIGMPFSRNRASMACSCVDVRTKIASPVAFILAVRPTLNVKVN